MAFWCSKTLEKRLPALIDKYEPGQIMHGAYQLKMGEEVFITSRRKGRKETIEMHKSIEIPPGQFAVLLTEERVKVPKDSLAFISLRNSVKARGLINVSGFHVDPGWNNKLKFCVYNAGPSKISITRGEEIFLLWYCNFDKPLDDLDLYDRNSEEKSYINSEDQNRLHGEIASPQQLKIDLDRLKIQYNVVIVIVIGIFLLLTASLFKN